jgi:UDP:flavonoid glycosyltransferase YjiC (YdhE family)
MTSSATFDSSQPLVIVAASGTGGDMYPFITLARGLQARGQQVLMLAPAYYTALVEAAGLPCRSFATPAAFQSMLDDPALWDERRGWGVLWNGLVPYLDALRELVRQRWPSSSAWCSVIHFCCPWPIWLARCGRICASSVPIWHRPTRAAATTCCAPVRYPCRAGCL